MDAGRRTINEIFNGSKILEIPYFQRSYVWRESNWERFLEDVEYVCSSNTPYFMGSLILKQQMTTSDSAVGDVRLVIDGQQRLTTISIFLKVYCLKKGINKRFEKRFMLDDEIGGGPVIHHNHNDVNIFNKIMKLESLEDLQGNDRITQAYRYFVANIDPQKLNFDTICSKILFVGIDLLQEDDEQQVFDTINSLGVTLTTAELLKNYFFTRQDIASYKKDWYDIFERDEETRAYWDKEITTGRIKRTYVDLFFYSYLLIKIQDSSYHLSTEEKVRFSKFERLFESYKSFVKNKCNDDRVGILKEIGEYATIFRNSISDDVLERELPPEAGIERINAVIFTFDTTTLIPYVMYVERNVLDIETKNDLYDALEAYVVRRVITRQTTKNYNRLFSERLIFNQVLSRDAFIACLAESDDGINRMPTDDEVRRAFHESVLVNKYATGVLYLIESKIRDRNLHSTGLLGVSKYSLEHLMPKKWRNKWAVDDDSFDEKLRDFKLLTMGNLAIITQSLNASIRDADWRTKKHGVGAKGGLIKYSDGLQTLSKYLDLDEWNEDRIRERAEYLANEALKIWHA